MIASDAWHPQVNGVVRTLDTTARMIRESGHRVEMITPDRFSQIPNPLYPEIPLSLPWPHRIDKLIRSFRPDRIHIATEGPIGHMMRRYCCIKGWNFTTSYHTKFPEYLKTLAGVPVAWSVRVLRWFHNGSSAVMVSTPTLEAELRSRGISSPIRRWSRGVDLTLFHPGTDCKKADRTPVLLYVGRVSFEKGIEDFLKIPTKGIKCVVGDGPARTDLERRYPDVQFLGYKKGKDLAAVYRNADLFVFPSRTDTFGIVIIEALASGLPVAAYPVTGPVDLITRPELGAIDENLSVAIDRALKTGNREICAEEAKQYNWERCTDQFVSNLVPLLP